MNTTLAALSVVRAYVSERLHLGTLEAAWALLDSLVAVPRRQWELEPWLLVAATPLLVPLMLAAGLCASLIVCLAPVVAAGRCPTCFRPRPRCPAPNPSPGGACGPGPGHGAAGPDLSGCGSVLIETLICGRGPDWEYTHTHTHTHGSVSRLSFLCAPHGAAH